MCLNHGGFPERGTGRPVAAAIARLTFSMSCVSCHYFQRACKKLAFNTVLSFIAIRRGGSQLLGKSCRPFAREARRLPRSIASAAHFVLDLWIGVTAAAEALGGRSRTFTGQCCQPFCPGDPTSHSDGPRVVTKYRHAKERIRLLRLHPAWELGLPSEPKRDTSRTIFTWPLRRRSLPPDAGCVPSFEVRVKISVRAWTRTGRI